MSRSRAMSPRTKEKFYSDIEESRKKAIEEEETSIILQRKNVFFKSILSCSAVFFVGVSLFILTYRYIDNKYYRIGLMIAIVLYVLIVLYLIIVNYKQ